MEEYSWGTRNTDHSGCVPEISPKAKKWVVKILIIIIALVVFQGPLYMVREITLERQRKSETVRNEIAKSWGGEQTVKLLPAAAKEDFSAEITPEIRYRGIYQTVVYTAKIKINAEYKNLLAGTVGEIQLADFKGIKNIVATVNGKNLPVDDNLKFQLPQGDSKCEITLSLRGSGNLQFAPSAANCHIEFTGNWNSPGFTGDALPEKRSISDNKFSAEWNLGKFSKDVKKVGVDLCITAGTYQQMERCFNYATFFLIVFFFTLLAAELITKVNIHPLQYLVSAGAPVLFYLMTLAFSEKAGFIAGYFISAVVIVAMVTMYAGMFLGKILPALIMGAIFAGSYLLNFIILGMEDLALMSGTIVLAVILGVLMTLTGKINRKPDNEKTDLLQ